MGMKLTLLAELKENGNYTHFNVDSSKKSYKFLFMKLPNLLHLFDVGIELEFFLVREGTVYNASKIMEDILGFSINQNYDNAGGLDLGSRSVLRTDGTACELQLSPYPYCEYTIGGKFKLIDKVKPLANYVKCFLPFLKQGELLNGAKTVFDSAGPIFSSGKPMRNAYTSKITIPDKKEGGEVSIRTAGLHLHFSLSSAAIFDHVRHKFNETVLSEGGTTHSDRLIKQLDSLYNDSIAPNNGALSKLRCEQYQKLGDYRIKYDTITKNPTFEYRQLDACLYHTPKKLGQFITAFQVCALEDLNKRLKDI